MIRSLRQRHFASTAVPAVKGMLCAQQMNHVSAYQWQKRHPIAGSSA